MKILIIQLRRIGDILLTGPAATYLKGIFPESTIHILSEPMGQSIMETHPSINRIMIYDKSDAWGMIKKVRAEKYDAVFDFMNNPRTRYLTFLSKAKWRVGWKNPFISFFYKPAVPGHTAPEYVPLRKIRMIRNWLGQIGKSTPEPKVIRPELFLTKEDELVAEHWMEKEGLLPNDFVVIAAASRIPTRSWRIEGFRSVAISLSKEKHKKVYMAWGPGEEGYVDDIRKGAETHIGRLPLTSIREMAAIFKRAALVITVDCGAMHTAVSVGTPTVTIYGPTRPIDWNPSLSGVGPRDIPLKMENLTEDRVLAACDKILTA